MAEGTPTVRQRQLGMTLRSYRVAADKSQDEAAAWAEISISALSRYETGKRRIKPKIVEKLLTFYGVEELQIEPLMRLAQQSDQRGWWVSYGSIPKYFTDYLGMEPAATSVDTYEQEVIPGLLQTEEYAQAFAADNGSDHALRFVQLRTARQKRLETPTPLILRAVLNEAVLHRAIGGPEVLRRQLRRLVERASLPNVMIRVLPFTAPAHRAMTSFVSLRFDHNPLNAVYVELDDGALYHEKPVDVERYDATFERLLTLSLSEGATIERIEEVENQI